MDEKKLRSAFAKIKSDMNALSVEIKALNLKVDKVNKSPSDTETDSKKQIENIEADFRMINELVKNFNEKFKDTTELVEKFSDQLEVYHEELLIIKKSLKENNNVTFDENVLNRNFSSFQELVNEKIDLEISSLRLEFTEEIAKMYDRFYGEIEKVKKEDKNIGAKVEAKEETIVQKTTKSAPEKKKKIETVEVEEDKKKEEGKFKKAVKWLFVDEDEDEMDQVRSEVEKTEKEKKKK